MVLKFYTLFLELCFFVDGFIIGSLDAHIVVSSEMNAQNEESCREAAFRLHPSAIGVSYSASKGECRAEMGEPDQFTL